MTLTAIRPAADGSRWFEELAGDRRAVSVHGPAGEFWCAVERRPAIEVLFPDAAVAPDHPCPARRAPAARPRTRPRPTCSAATWTAAARRRPRTWPRPPACRTPTSRSRWPGWRRKASPSAAASRPRHPHAADRDEEFCARRLLARIHSYTRQRQRREIEPVTARDFMRFLLRWQHVAPGTQAEGRLGVLSVIEQLQGYELAAGAWENAVLAAPGGRLPARVARRGCACRARSPGAGCRCATASPTRRRGAAGWSRPGPPRSPWPSAMTCPGCCARPAATWRPPSPDPAATRDVLDALRQHGALFRPDLGAITGRLPSEVEEALWDGVARGLVTADGFRAVRSLLAAAARGPGRPGCADCGGAGAARRARRRPGGGRCSRVRRSTRTATSWPRPWPSSCGPLGRGLPRSGGPGEPRPALARDLVGVPADGGPGHHPRRPVRRRVQRRAVRPSRRPRRAAHASASSGPTGEPVADLRRRPAEPDQHRAARPADPAIPANTVTYVDGAVASATTADPARAAS